MHTIINLVNILLDKLCILLQHWSFTILVIVIIFKRPISEFLQQISNFSLNKDGIEIKKIMNAAKNIISETHLLTATVYIPLLDILSRNASDSPYIVKDKLNIRLEIEKFIQDNNIKNKNLENKIISLNCSILKDVITAIIKNETFRMTLLDMAIYEALNENHLSRDYSCSPDINKIIQKLQEYNYTDTTKIYDIDYVQYILEEAEYFQENNRFMDIDKLTDSMSKAMKL